MNACTKIKKMAAQKLNLQRPKIITSDGETVNVFVPLRKFQSIAIAQSQGNGENETHKKI